MGELFPGTLLRHPTNIGIEIQGTQLTLVPMTTNRATPPPLREGSLLYKWLRGREAQGVGRTGEEATSVTAAKTVEVLKDGGVRTA